MVVRAETDRLTWPYLLGNVISETTINVGTRRSARVNENVRARRVERAREGTGTKVRRSRELFRSVAVDEASAPGGVRPERREPPLIARKPKKRRVKRGARGALWLAAAFELAAATNVILGIDETGCSYRKEP